MSPLLLCWIAGPLLIGAVLLRRSGDKRDVLADVPFVIRRPCPLAGRGLGLLSGGVVFPKLSKLLSQENALGAPCLDTVIVALRRHTLAGAPRLAGTGGILRTGVIRYFGVTLRLATPDIRLAQALMLSRWWAADARVERMGARPYRAVVVKTALTCGSYSHSSTVLGWRPERERNYLVTMSARC